MSYLEEKKSSFVKQLADAKDTAETTNCLNSLKVIGELEKIEIDKRKAEADIKKAEADIENIKYQRKTDWARMLSSVAPLLTSLILVVTLMVNINQTASNNLQRQQDKEDEKWTQLLAKMSSPTGGNDVAIPPLLKTFFYSDRYQNNAIDLSTSYLSNVQDQESFKVLFGDYIKVINKNNYSYVVRLTGKLINQFYSEDRQLSQDSSALKFKPSDFIKKKIADDQAKITQTEIKIDLASLGLVEVIKKISKDESNSGSINGKPFDLTDANFHLVKLDSISLAGAVLTNVSFDRVSLLNTDLAQVKHFDNANFGFTAWWQAKVISDDLTAYLIKYFPYNPDAEYFEAPDQKKNETLYEKYLQQAGLGH